MQLNNDGKFAYALGFIKMLDGYLQDQGVDEKQRMLKNHFVIKKAIELFIPDKDVAEIRDFMNQIESAMLDQQIISEIQKRIDHDVFINSLKKSGFDELFKKGV